ncbi:MAG: DUF721 domain-containing protein [Zoogloeaceae bacterium]|jgi:hypothetical protein|nr:DUF721 domain-containing protein [Zoogloeaceae bacterium]
MQSTEQWFAKSEGIARFLPRVQLLTRLNALMQTTLPPALADEARVIHIRERTVVIRARNAAVATKLRQFNERLLRAFSTAVLECNNLQVKIQPVQSREEIPAYQEISSASRDGKRALPPLPPRAIQNMRAALRALPETSSRTAAAIKKLLARRDVSL